MHISQLLAWRFLQGAADEKNISFMIKLCFISIFISTAALTLVAAIMNGFEHATHKKLQGIHSDIIIRSPQQPLNFEKIKDFLYNTQSKNLIEAMSPLSTGEIIIQNPSAPSVPTNLIALKGVNPFLESKVSSISSMLIDNNHTLESLLTDNAIIIGNTLAHELQLKVGDFVRLLIPTDTQLNNNKITLDSYDVTLTGLFKTGIEEVDEHMAYGSLDLFNSLLDTGITAVNIKLKDSVDAEYALQAIKKEISLPVNSWKDFYPALVSALFLEKYVMIIILGLIILIASMNIISLLFMYIIQKRGEIALLHAMGLSYNKISTIFILLGVEIAAVASLAGIVVGSILSLLLEKYPFIKLPDAYYVSYLPAKLDILLNSEFFIIVLIISLGASWLAVRSIKTLSTSSLLKGL